VGAMLRIALDSSTRGCTKPPHAQPKEGTAQETYG